MQKYFQLTLMETNVHALIFSGIDTRSFIIYSITFDTTTASTFLDAVVISDHQQTFQVRPWLPFHVVVPQYFLFSGSFCYLFWWVSRYQKAISTGTFEHGSDTIHPIIFRRFLYSKSPLMLLTQSFSLDLKISFISFQDVSFFSGFFPPFCYFDNNSSRYRPFPSLPLGKANAYSKYDQKSPENPQKAQCPIFIPRCTKKSRSGDKIPRSGSAGRSKIWSGLKC